jgi:hypothetical protein
MRMLKNIVTSGVVIALMVTMTATVAGAQPGNGYAYGLDRQPICHNGKTLDLPKPAIEAHLNHGDNEGACGPEAPTACSGDPVEGAEIEVDETAGTVPDVVDNGDALLIAGSIELADGGAVSVTVEDEDGTRGTFQNGVNSEITQEDGGLLIRVIGEPIVEASGADDVLSSAGLTGVSSEGVSCADEETGTPETTEAGDALPTMTSEDVLKPDHPEKAQKQEEWL